MTTIYWCPSLGVKQKPNIQLHPSMEIFFQEPEPLFKAVVAQYPNGEFLGCPAVTDFCKNTYVVRAPFDLTVTYNKLSNELGINRLGQAFFNSFCTLRPDGSIETAPAYLFYAKESVKIETLPVFLLKSPTADATYYIPGQFDIGKWMRCVVWNFFMKDESQPLTIREGDPLFFVRFTPADGSKVVLERVEYDYRHAKVVDACIGVKHYVPKLPIQKLYALADGYIKNFLRRNK